MAAGSRPKRALQFLRPANFAIELSRYRHFYLALRAADVQRAPPGTPPANRILGSMPPPPRPRAGFRPIGGIPSESSRARPTHLHRRRGTSKETYVAYVLAITATVMLVLMIIQTSYTEEVVDDAAAIVASLDAQAGAAPYVSDSRTLRGHSLSTPAVDAEAVHEAERRAARERERAERSARAMPNPHPERTAPPPPAPVAKAKVKATAAPARAAPAAAVAAASADRWPAAAAGATTPSSDDDESYHVVFSTGCSPFQVRDQGDLARTHARPPG